MKATGQQSNIIMAVAAGLFFLAGIVPAQADIKEIKKYKEAFPESKPKCVECHLQEKPKKDDGQHEMNDYGKAVLEKAKETTADTYKELGKIEDFKVNKQ